MSRDRTPDEIIEDMMFRPRRELEEQEQRLYILYRAAREEGMVVGILAALAPGGPLGSRECPLCLTSALDLRAHIQECERAPRVDLLPQEAQRLGITKETEGQRDSADVHRPEEWCTGCNTDHDPKLCGYRDKDQEAEGEE